MTKRTFFSPYFFASNQANLCVSVRSDPVFDSSRCFDHTHVHTSSRMQGCSENHELVLFGAGCSAVILVCAFPFACLLWCRSSEDFQGGQIVPEAAPGAVTTTGQLFQSTGPLLGDVIETHAFGGTQRWQHTHTHRAQTDTARLDDMQPTREPRKTSPFQQCDMFKCLSVVRTSHDCCSEIIRLVAAVCVCWCNLLSSKNV